MIQNRQVEFAAPGEVVVADRPIPDPGLERVLIEMETTLISAGTELTFFH